VRLDQQKYHSERTLWYPPSTRRSGRVVITRKNLRAGRPLPFAVTACAWLAILAAFNHELVGNYTLYQIGSYNLSSLDLMVVAPAIACIQLLVRRSHLLLDSLAVLVIGFGAIVLMNLLRGVPSYGLAALMALRAGAPVPEYLFLATLLVRERFNYRPLVNAIIWGSAALSVFALFRFVLGADFFFFGTFESVDQINDGGRALTSGGTMLLGSGVLLVAGRLVSSKGVTKTKAALDLAWRLPILLYTHQASAVAASLAGLATFMVLSRGKERPLRLFAAAFALIVIAGFFFFGNNLPNLPEWAVGDLTQRVSNLEMRHEIWQGLIRSYTAWPPLDRSIGPPSGLLPEIIVHINNRSAEWAVSMHSAYYGALATVGAAGLLIYVLLVGTLAGRSAWRALHVNGDVNGFALAAAIATSFIVFGYGYEIRGEQSLMMCLAYVLAARKPRLFVKLPVVRQPRTPAPVTSMASREQSTPAKRPS
jgi:hypothetical protein